MQMIVNCSFKSQKDSLSESTRSRNFFSPESKELLIWSLNWETDSKTHIRLSWFFEIKELEDTGMFHVRHQEKTLSSETRLFVQRRTLLLISEHMIHMKGRMRATRTQELIFSDLQMQPQRHSPIIHLSILKSTHLIHLCMWPWSSPTMLECSFDFSKIKRLGSMLKLNSSEFSQQMLGRKLFLSLDKTHVMDRQHFTQTQMDLKCKRGWETKDQHSTWLPMETMQQLITIQSTVPFQFSVDSTGTLF